MPRDSLSKGEEEMSIYRPLSSSPSIILYPIISGFLFYKAKIYAILYIAMLETFRDKTILILGFGREGQDTFLFLRKLFPGKTLGVADTNPDLKGKIKDENINWHLGKDYLKSLGEYDVIIKTPGIPIHLPEIEKAFKLGKITSQTKIFFQNCPGTIIGITGTKGKSTTTSLIYNILKQAGKNAYLIGNIGEPVLKFLDRATKNDYFVYELSSHQLYNMDKSPYIAILLNIYPEHLDYCKTFSEYANSKANITKYQTKNDYLIFDSKNKTTKSIAKKSKAVKIPINIKNIPKIIPIKDIPLMGEHNLKNVSAAIEVAKILKIPIGKIKLGVKSFEPLAHRLEKVGTFRGITFYNDALSTIPEATIVAMNTLGKNVQTIMLGGFDRGIKFNNLAKEILKTEIKNAILFPTTGEKIWKGIMQQSKNKTAIKSFFVDNMEDAVKIAYKNTDIGKICLLSTASTSFSIFKDYGQKGELFKKYIKKYSR